MGKSSPSPPPPPDPAKTAAAQTASNQATARTNAALNRVNQYTPYGSIEYTDLGNDRWEANVALSPEQQQMLDLTNQGKIAYGQTGLNAMDRVRQIMGTTPDFSGLPQINNGAFDRQRVEDALFARMQPKLSAQREALDTRLRNQGLTPGSEAWKNAMQEYAMSENDARLAAIGAAGTEQQRLFGMSTADRERAMREMMAARGIPLNEAAALLGGSQVNYPQFSAVAQTQVQPTDIAGINNAAYNAQMANYNAQMQQQAGMFGGLASLGGAAIGLLSDKRAKENIQEIGKSDNDLPIYLFNYKGDPEQRMGVMAQDVKKEHPDAVMTGPDGMMRVDLERAVMASRSRKKGSAHV